MSFRKQGSADRRILVLEALVVLVALTGTLSECSGDDAAELSIDLLGGRVVVPKSAYNVTIWPGYALNPGWQFPELGDGDYSIPALKAKPNFGIGVSGGGLRATSLALGWLRGMNMLGYLKKARYLGSASGGSLANIMVTYTAPELLSVRFGKYVPPNRASVKALQNLGDGTFIYTVVHMNNFYQSFLENLARDNIGDEGTTTAGAFARTVSSQLLMPLEAGNWNSTVTALGTKGNIHRRLMDIAKEWNLTLYATSPDLPFPLITGNVFDSTAKQPFFPFEMTPLYYGCPADFTGHAGPLNLTGKGIMEPLAFNAVPTRIPTDRKTGQTTIEVRSEYVTPLASQIAVSGGIMAVELQKYIQSSPNNGTENSREFGQPYFKFFDMGDNYEMNAYPFADGGYIDNEGLWAMLRRKVKKILIFYAVPDGSTNITKWSTSNTGLSLPFGRCDDCYGYLNVSTPLMNNLSRVFDPAAFDSLFNTYQANQQAGRVNWWNATLDVYENKFMGVPGGWKVDLMVVMNAVVKNWEDKLPADTQQALKDAREDPLTIARFYAHPLETYKLVGFPFPPIYLFKYGSLMAGALSQSATWHVMELQKQIAAFIARPDA